MAATWYKRLLADHAQCGTANTTNFLALIALIDSDFAQTGSGGKSLQGSGFDIRPFKDSALLQPLRYYLIRYNGTTGRVVIVVEVPTLSFSVDTPIYLSVGDSSISSNGSDTAIFANVGGWYPLGDGSTLSLTDIANGANLTNAGATAAAGPVDGAAHIAGDFSIANYPVLYRASTADYSYGTNSFSVRVAAKYGTQNSSQNNYPDIIGKQNVRTADELNVGWELRIDTGGAGTDNHPQLVLWDQPHGGSLDFMDSGAAYNDNQWHIYHFTVDRGLGKLRLWVDGVEVSGSNATMSTTDITSNFDMCLGARAYHEVFQFDALNGYVAEPVLSAPGVVWSPSQVTAEANMLKQFSNFFAVGDLTPARRWLLVRR